MNDYNYYLNKIIRFNGDNELLSLREKYNEPSFFEIISKERSETTFSSYLKWLFQCKVPLDSSNPIMMLLDILIRRDGEQGCQINNELKNAIISRKLKIKTMKVETEQPLSDLARIVFDALCTNNEEEYRNGQNSKWKYNEKFSEPFLIANNSRDRVDLFIDCEITGLDDFIKRLQIIIENKVDSKESGGKTYTSEIDLPQKYKDGSQTTRYYMGSHRRDAKSAESYQLYVYLTPLPSEKLDQFRELTKDPNRKTDFRDNENFIQINYQDVLDGIVSPLLHLASLPDRTRFFLEEFKNELSYPNVNSKKGPAFIAISKDVSKSITDKWADYKDLLCESAITAIQDPIWFFEGNYYGPKPKKELLATIARVSKDLEKELIEKKWISSLQNKSLNKSLCDTRYYYNSRINYETIESFAKDHQITIPRAVKQEPDTNDLLSSFWEENKLFIVAMIHSLDPESRRGIQVIIDSLAKRDTSKYMVYYDDRPLCDKPLNNSRTVACIVNKWVDLQNGPVTIKKLNETFPRSISEYYDKGQYYSGLFVDKKNCSFDGEKGNKEHVPDDCWDIDWGGRFDIFLSKKDPNSQDATLLKMWRRGDVEHFIDYIGKNIEEFKNNRLTVVKK